MGDYDPNADGNAETDLDYLKPTRYLLTDDPGGTHTHVFYLRDDLPLATTDGLHRGAHHSHSIQEGPEDTVICLPAEDHTHNMLIVEEPGDYAIRTLYDV